ncbi:uncharacterized protein K460DRAFT_245076, partial [Cucurbitaria berberidis CBS 394.84]
MFKQAVQVAAVASTSPSNPTYKQSSLGDTFGRTDSTQSQTTRPLASGTKHNSAGTYRPPGQVTHGIKRTSGGLVKSLSSQEDNFDYPTLNIGGMGKENDLPTTFHTSSKTNSTNLVSALFDENDFDSDVDLEVEDPATKGTVAYPTLPRVAPTASIDSRSRSRAPTAHAKLEPNSSQPIPWSSSPLEHLKTPPKPSVVKTKRRALPWDQNQKAQAKHEMEDQIESEEETARPKKRKSVEVAQAASTPAPKESKSDYQWNTTASALKLQQKNFREKSKAQSKVGQGTEDDVKEAIKKKKKNTVHRIFLSEEQQNVLNLVTEYKKSVFFTGSAGTGKSVLLREIIAALRKKYVREPDRVAVTASTGLAACNIGGVTLHSFSGIGLGKEPAEDLVKKIRRN